MNCFKSLIISLTICCVFCNQQSSQTASPVMFWSPEKSLGLPEASHNAMEPKVFFGNFLAPVLGSKATVVFLQDQLSMDDFTRFADVYSMESDGGAFRNVKQMMDQRFSHELPAVVGAAETLQQAVADFKGQVLRLSSVADLKNLEINKGSPSLVLVTLQPTADALDRESALKTNDELIGAVCDHLKKRSIDYTAIYTGGPENSASAPQVHSGRQLLAVDADTPNGTLYNISGTGLLFMKSAVLVVKSGGKTTNKLDIVPRADDAKGSVINNKTALIKLSFSAKDNSTGQVYTPEIEMNVEHQGDRWVMKEITMSGLKLENGTLEGNLTNPDLDLVVPILYSFHCTDLVLRLDTQGKTHKNLAYKGTYIKIKGFQFQPFNVQKDRFFNSVDCVGFFTLGIWMGILPAILLLSILLGGALMLLNLSIMDKYDDPKGKTISVAVGSD